MSRKDYILIAAALAEAKPSAFSGEPEGRYAGFHEGWLLSVSNVATALAQDNPRFDCERFLKAAGVQS